MKLKITLIWLQLFSSTFGINEEFPVCTIRIPLDIDWCYDLEDGATEYESRCFSTGNSLSNKQEDSLDETNVHPVCRKDIKITSIIIEPYEAIIKDLLDTLIKICCGSCMDEPFIYTIYDDPKSFADDLNHGNHSGGKFDIIYPILGSIGETSVYEYNFIPFIKIKTMMLITLRKSKIQMMKDLVNACLKLWPFLTICLLMAFVAGFFGWILDTWSNEKEFPRPFFAGLYHGFWWSFVSMTTVGYGDKAPRSFLARIFSVGWILIGVTICSMFTASLTTAITDAAQIQSSDLKGMKVGILDKRVLEAAFIVRDGGVVGRVHRDFDTLLTILENGTIDGIFMDLNSGYEVLTDFLDMTKYQVTWKDFSSEKMSYGALFKDFKMYNFFNSFMIDNEMLFQTCINRKKVAQKNEKQNFDVFAPSSGLFWPFFYGTVSTIAVLLCGGAIYEYFRRKKIVVKVEQEMNDADKLIQDIELILKQIKTKKEI